MIERLSGRFVAVVAAAGMLTACAHAGGPPRKTVDVPLLPGFVHRPKGPPVKPPPGTPARFMDPRYVRKVVQAAFKAAGPGKITAVDCSEFPCVVHWTASRGTPMADLHVGAVLKAVEARTHGWNACYAGEQTSFGAGAPVDFADLAVCPPGPSARLSTALTKRIAWRMGELDKRDPASLDAAKHPFAPPTDPQAIFSGCRLVDASASSYHLRCTKLEAISVVLAGTGLPADARRKSAATVLTQGLPATAKVRRSTVPLALAGADRTSTRLDFTDAHGRKQTDWVAAYDTRGGRDVNLLCGGKPFWSELDCPLMMAWMAAHPTTPPPVPRAASHARTWPTQVDLAALTGCHGHRKDDSSVQLQCHGDGVYLERLTPVVDADTRRRARLGVHQVATLALESIRRNRSAATTLTDVPCRVGRDAPSTCERIVSTGGRSPAMTALVGAGRILGVLALVECVHHGPSPGARGPCPRFLTLGAAQTAGPAAPPQPARTPAGRPTPPRGP